MAPKNANEKTPQNDKGRELFVTADTTEPLTEQMMNISTKEEHDDKDGKADVPE